MNELLSLTKTLAQEHKFLCYLIVFIVSYLESLAFVGLIMPGAGFAFSAGALAYYNYFNIYYLIIAGSIGAILADITSFYLAFYLKDKKIFIWLKKRYKTSFEKGELFFKKYGQVSIFLGRFIGFTRPVVPFIAGLFKMDKNIFLIYCSISGILWGMSYYGAGYLMALGFSIIPDNQYKIIALVILILCLVFIKKVKKQRKG